VERSGFHEAPSKQPPLVLGVLFAQDSNIPKAEQSLVAFMTTPPYPDRTHPATNSIAAGPGTVGNSTPTPLVSHRNNDFTLADLEYLTEQFTIVDIEHADSDTTPTRVWVDKRPRIHTHYTDQSALEDRHISIYRGDYIRGAFTLPDGTERVIWEHAVFDDGTQTDLTPKEALIDAQAADSKPLSAVQTQPHYRTPHPYNND